ncbi:sulfotransferase ssu-1-like [Ixodes scapularis]|uniref:sulfotransferase ssu-1-like n=1 Tax=Ixodes scapularis TaxID=6945 RepID=UPI001A9D9E02|nr:sulfotransferase ssu-1-like [Ixodes scapularis]
MDHQRRVPLSQFVDGIRYSPLVPPAMARKAVVYRPGDGDIILVTYPKSGTLWTMHIIQLILGRGQGATSFPDFMRQTPRLENHGPEALEGLPLPRMLGTHQKLLLQNFNDRAKYVYVARNPWDTCVSLYHFMRGITEFQFEDGTFDDFFEAFVTGDLCYGDYFGHVLHGYARKGDPNVFFFTYEQLKADTPGMILKLAYFLGEEYGKMLEGDQTMFREILNKSSFDFMSRVLEPGAKVLSAVLGDLSTRMGKGNNIRTESDEENGFRFFRKGKVNSWKELFTPEQTQRMQTRIDEMTLGTDLMQLWNEK